MLDRVGPYTQKRYTFLVHIDIDTNIDAKVAHDAKSLKTIMAEAVDAACDQIDQCPGSQATGIALSVESED